MAANIIFIYQYQYHFTDMNIRLSPLYQQYYQFPFLAFLFFPISFNHLNSNYLSFLNPKLIYILILIFSLILVFILPSIGCRGTVALTYHATQTVYVRWQYIRSIGVWSIQINSKKTREEMKRDKKIMKDKKERSSRNGRMFLGLFACF